MRNTRNDVKSDHSNVGFNEHLTQAFCHTYSSIEVRNARHNDPISILLYATKFKRGEIYCTMLDSKP